MSMDGGGGADGRGANELVMSKVGTGQADIQEMYERALMKNVSGVGVGVGVGLGGWGVEGWWQWRYGMIV